MGSTASICNYTECVLNVAMKQLTPLYYENALQPGDCIDREVGRVWFTLEGRLWNGENGYDTMNDIVLPITLISLAALTAVAGGFVATGALGSLAGVATMTSQIFTIGEVIIAAGASNAAKSLIQQWVSHYAVREHGIYMGYDRTLNIRGGPNCTQFAGFQVVNTGTGNDFWLEYL